LRFLNATRTLSASQERSRDMDERPADGSIDVPRPDAWLSFGLAALALGVWLLRLDDPFLLTLWGVGLVIIGVSSTVVSAGMLLRIWR
jgi:hypothetical protein